MQQDPDTFSVLEPFFSYDEENDLYSIALVSSCDRRVISIRLDEPNAMDFYWKYKSFLCGVQSQKREHL